MKRKVIAVTGKIGSGKSTVCRYLAQKGYPVLDCDVLAKRVADDPDLIAKVGELLGSEYVVGGAIDRKAVRAKIFADDELLQAYNRLFFDRVKQSLTLEIEQISAPVVFAEIAVFDAFPFPWTDVWAVVASDEERSRRVVLRDNVTSDDVERISSAQKLPSGVTVIHNDGSLDDLYRRVDGLLAQFR